MFRSVVVFVATISLVALFATACSDDTEQPAKDATSNQDAAPPTEGGGGDTGTPTEASGPSCRTYGTEGTLTAGGNTFTITASFDPATLEISSEIKNATMTQNNVDTYASLEDFVDEVSAVGKQLLIKRVEKGDFSDSTATYTYDASKRLIKREQTAATFTYSAWDSEGRPTAGTAEFTQRGCGGVELTIVYDDQALTKTTSYHDPTGTCLSEDRKDQDKYDADGNWAGQVMQMGTPDESTATIEYTKSAQVCK
jgi:hypothetical protein